MSLRNFNNVTTIGSLTGPLASSGTTATVSGFSNNPTAPFTVTIDRNLPTEEICLVSNVTGTTLTLVRGFDGTAAQAHSAGATVEHTAGAIEYGEANAHVNATTNVHGTTGSLVADQGAQTIFDKTLVSPVLQADVAAGDAAVAYVPPDASARNMFRGVGPDGADKITVDSSGNIVSAGVAVTTLVSAATSAATGNAIVKRNATGGATISTLTVNNAPAGASDATRKDYVDTQVATKAAIAGDLGGTAAAPTVIGGTHHTHTSAQTTDAASAATPNVQIKRDANGRAQVVDPAVAADIATKNYVDNKPLARARRVGAQSIPNGGSFWAIVFDTKDYDTTGTQYAASGLTIRQAGYYRVVGGYTGDPSSVAGRRALNIAINGVASSVGRLVPGSVQEAGVLATGIIQLAVNDVVTLTVFQDSGAALNTSSNTSYGSTFLEIEFLRP